MNAVERTLIAERLPDTATDLVEQALSFLDAGDQLGYDVSINAARRESGIFCYTCGGIGEVRGVSGRPDETDACSECGPQVAA